MFSPLSVGVRGVTREKRATQVGLVGEMLNFRLAHSRSRLLRATRSWAGENLVSALSRHPRRVEAAFRAEIERERPRIVLISTYLMYRGLAEALCAICQRAGIPVLLGGPYFAQREVVEDWASIPGATALAAGEIENRLADVIERIAAGEDATVVPGIVMRGDAGLRGTIARPLRQLDSLPFPDFSDFPWSSYPDRIVPVLTGRGCGWGACSFCSDVAGTAGRSFRSRDPLAVLDEIRHQHEALGADLFVFTDMKLNSNLEMWRTLISKLQDVAPGARWIASVHVGARGENGLSLPELRAVADAGCVRLTTGLESGSQRVLDSMKKGVRLDRVSDFLSGAARSGISPRATMIAGYPGETARDIAASAAFVDSHRQAIERIKLCTFSATIGTGIDRQLGPGLPRRPAMAKIDYVLPAASTPAYRRAMSALLRSVHRVNRRPLPERASVFEGVM